jgi:hypothetical protein
MQNLQLFMHHVKGEYTNFIVYFQSIIVAKDALWWQKIKRCKHAC